MKDLVTVLTDIQEANLAIPKSILEDNGVESFITQAFGSVYVCPGFMLEVAEKDVEAAIELLVEAGFITKENSKGYSDPLTRFVSKIFGAKDE